MPSSFNTISLRTVTSPYEIVGAAPELRLTETDQVAPVGMWRLRVTGDVFSIERATASDWSTVSTPLSIQDTTSITLGLDSILCSNNTGFTRNTNDGSDNGSLIFGGGGGGSSTGTTRGAILGLYGNEHATKPGYAELSSGNVANALLLIQWGATTVAQLSSADGLEIIGGKKLLSSSSTPIGIQVTNGSLTVGSAGSIVVPVNAGAASDALFGNLSGCTGLDTTNNAAYWRVGATWKSVAVAGFKFPRYSDYAIVLGVNGDYDETICPLCRERMQPRQGFGLVGDRWTQGTYGLELHSYGAHLECLVRRTPVFQRLSEDMALLEQQVAA